LKPTIPFHKPFTDRDELTAVEHVFSTGILRGDGPTSRELQTILCKDLACKHLFFTTSCTHALEMAIMCLNLNSGDEVIIPSFTFVSTANAIVIHGGKPVYADILHGTLNIDPEDVKKKITHRTRAIIPVHYAGVAANVSSLRTIIGDRNILIIEDAAQGVDASFEGKALGTLGDIGCFSFHDTKNITCGEGGAFITNSDDIARKAEIIREKGTNRSAFLRGEVDKYTWINKGSSFIQSDILAGILMAQWKKRDQIKKLRKYAWQTYSEALKKFQKAGFITLPVIPENCESNYHTFFLNTVNLDHRDTLLSKFKESGIGASFHYVPLHSSPYGRQLSTITVSLPQTDYLSSSLIRLPLYPALESDHPDFAKRVVDVLNDYFHLNRNKSECN
jgi:dTDP-4-amino-4,6-dideoxygalactose transaminase